MHVMNLAFPPKLTLKEAQNQGSKGAVLERTLSKYFSRPFEVTESMIHPSHL